MLLRLAPPLTVLLFIGPVAAGLIGTALPALGPEPWAALAALPGLGGALGLTLLSGAGGTGLALAAAVAITAATHDGPRWRSLRWTLPILLAVPHLASAIGLGFLVAPSGWIARLLSPWLTGWTRPPGLATVNDPHGLALTLGLALRETPFLLFALQAAAAQVDTRRQLQAARSLGYGSAEAWAKIALPQLFPLLRLPLYAVLAFALSSVDMAVVLGPNVPAPLAVELVRLANDPDPGRHPVAAAGALLLLALGLALVVAARFAEAALASAHGRLAAGRSRLLDLTLRASGATLAVATVALGLAGLAALVLWSISAVWRFPAALPPTLSAAGWTWAAANLRGPLATTLTLAAAGTGIALVLALACLEHESRSGPRPAGRVLWLVYLPLLVPQVSFLFGLQVALVTLRLDGTWAALVWAHLAFVLPYVFLMLREPYLALHPAYAAAARVLGRREGWVFLRIKLPLLRRPIATAAAVGFTASLALYLPTLFAGAGRFATLTTETLALAGGGDRRLAATAGLVLALIPLVALALAALVRAPAGLRAGPRDRRR